MICFGILRIFGEKTQNKKNGIWAFWAPMPQHREPTPRHSLTPHRGMPRRGEAEVPKRAPGPRVCHDVALLRYSVAILCCDVDTVHSEKIFGFCFERLIFVHRLFRNSNK